MNISYSTILEIIKNFYDVATKDIMIGYHFRVIDDFESHIPRIAYFWQLQLTGKIEDNSHLPFKLLEVHKDLRINFGEVDRWVKLFTAELDKHILKETISIKDKENWLVKIELFKSKIQDSL